MIAALLARRMVLLRGTLDHDQASEVAAALMTLDATGDEHIELRITGAGGGLETGLMLMDVMSVLGVPVHTVGVGVLTGGAVGVLAAGADRRLARHARLQLREADTSIAGTAFEVERLVAEHAVRREHFHCELARHTRRPVGEITAEWEGGAFFDPADAVALGYADRVE